MRRKKSEKTENVFSLRDSFSYIIESSVFIYSALVIFLISSIIGFLFPDQFTGYFDDMIRELVLKTDGLNPIQLILFIFNNNLMAAFLAMASGIVLGIVPLSNMIVNGLLLGYVMSIAVSIEGWLTLLRLAPHGIFELPAIFISVGLGLRLGTFILAGRGKKIESLKRMSFESLRVFITVVLPLLIAAAIIEGIFISFF